MTRGGEGGILCKLSATARWFWELQKKFPGKRKKGLTKRSWRGKLIKLSEDEAFGNGEYLKNFEEVEKST